ncbi:hypothetical protein ACI7YT_14395 [Microbacterium sp. M]|uniref:hypothetical protein n=1 Tax=Microbacterium sp. M TaxID=3377125 RepID=UPI00386ED0D4
MTDGVDDGELRELRAKAYGPGGGLTDAEARRLEELEALVRGTTPAPTPQADSAAGDAAVDGSASVPQWTDPQGSGAAADVCLRTGPDATGDRNADAGDLEAAGESRGSGESPETAKPGIRGILTRRWFPYAAVGLALLIGFGVGLAVFGQAVMQSVALSLAAGAEQAELEAEGSYDPGSITPLGQSHGATIWHATRDEGKNHCLVITLEDRIEPACVPGDQLSQPGGGLYASMNLPADGDGDVSGLNVTVIRDINDDLAVVAHVWDSNDVWDWRSQYSEDELAIVDRIESETGVGGEFLQIVGYDGDRPVWQEFSGPSACVIVAVVGSVERACAQDASSPVVLEVANPDGTSTSYRVTTSDTRGPTLTIERASAPGMDAAIDDRTGDVEP